MMSAQQPRELSFTLPHITLAAQQWGNPDGPLVLALHGWLDNAASFEPMAPYLQQANVIAIDFAGHGHSAKRPDQSSYHFIDSVDDLHCLIHQQGWTDITILGHSMGGMLGQLLTAACPDRIANLILIEAFGLMTTKAEDTVSQLIEGLGNRRKLEQADEIRPFAFETAVRARVAAGDLEAEHVAKLIERSTIAIANDKYLWRSDKRLRNISLYRFSPEQCMQVLKNISVPTLLIVGDMGYKFIDQNLAAFSSAMPQLKKVVLPGGHHLHMQNPEPVARVVNDFLTF